MSAHRITKLSRSVNGRTVLITGAASGMGRATAYLFADEGAHVAALDRNAKGLEETVGTIQQAGGSAIGLEVDLEDSARIADAVEETASRFGSLDIVVNNAGISRRVAIDDQDFESIWNRTVSVLLTAQTAVIRAALPHLRRSEAARIVNIASTEGLGATPGIAPYTAAKHGVIGLTRSLAVELGREGITVNCICPGPILTGMTAAIPEEHKETYAKRRTALGRYGDPEEVAHLTLSCCLPSASFLTGATIQVDGGLTVRRA